MSLTIYIWKWMGGWGGEFIEPADPFFRMRDGVGDECCDVLLACTYVRRTPRGWPDLNAASFGTLTEGGLQHGIWGVASYRTDGRTEVLTDLSGEGARELTFIRT